MNLLNCCYPLTNRVNHRVRRIRHHQRCHHLQAPERGKKTSWLHKTPWTPPASARHLLCPVRTPSLLWSDVSTEWTSTRLTIALMAFASGYDYSLAINLSIYFTVCGFCFLSFRVWTRNCQLASIWCCQGDRWETAPGSPSGTCFFRVLQREDSGTTSSHAATSQASAWNQRSVLGGL